MRDSDCDSTPLTTTRTVDLNLGAGLAACWRLSLCKLVFSISFRLFSCRVSQLWYANSVPVFNAINSLSVSPYDFALYDDFSFLAQFVLPIVILPTSSLAADDDFEPCPARHGSVSSSSNNETFIVINVTNPQPPQPPLPLHHAPHCTALHSSVIFVSHIAYNYSFNCYKFRLLLIVKK